MNEEIGCKRLWSSVMVRSIEDIKKYLRLPNNRYVKQDYENACWWIFQDNRKSDHLNSFEAICELFSMDPEKTRLTIKQIIDEGKEKTMPAYLDPKPMVNNKLKDTYEIFLNHFEQAIDMVILEGTDDFAYVLKEITQIMAMKTELLKSMQSEDNAH